MNELSRMFREEHILTIPEEVTANVQTHGRARNLDGNHRLGKLQSINHSVRIAIALQITVGSNCTPLKCFVTLDTSA